MRKARNVVEIAEKKPEIVSSIEHRPLKGLIPYARNARTHSADQVDQIVGSIMEFGFTNPILADENGIVAGHGRVLAAQKIYNSGRVIRLPNGTQLPKGQVPVLDCTGWTEAQRRAYIIADNKLALNAGWDQDILSVELDELRDMDFSLDLIGFDRDELNNLIGTPNVPPPATAPKEREGTGFVIQYNIVFDSVEQQDLWFGFMRMLKGKYPDEDTIGARLDRHIQELEHGES